MLLALPEAFELLFLLVEVLLEAGLVLLFKLYDAIDGISIHHLALRIHSIIQRILNERDEVRRRESAPVLARGRGAEVCVLGRSDST